MVERAAHGLKFENAGMSSEVWTKAVVTDLLESSCSNVRRGNKASLVRFGSILPFGTLDGTANNL